MSFLRSEKLRRLRWLSDIASTPNTKWSEIASNDGYLLKNFQKAERPGFGDRTLGECRRSSDGSREYPPAFNSSASRRLGPPQGRPYPPIFSSATTCSRMPDINDFVGGLKDSRFRKTGIVTMEFPHRCRCWTRSITTRSTTSIIHICRCSASRRFCASRADHLRRRGNRAARRLASDLCLPHAGQKHIRCSRERRRASRARTCRRGEFAGAVSRFCGKGSTQQTPTATVLIDAKENGRDRGWLWRPGKGQHASQSVCGVRD